MATSKAIAKPMTREDVTDLIYSAKVQKGLKWGDVAKKLKLSKEWTTAACMGQMTLTKAQALVIGKTFDLPASPVKSGQSGSIGIMKIYKSSNKTVLVGTSYLTYQILSHTANSVFIVMTTTNFNDNDNLVSTMTEVYGRNPAVDKEYKLIRTTVKYNNPRRNEVVIE